ncbi:MAG TPA: hypothetical protein VHM25_21335 [Polyangiaceae bacterium]|jgi:hypothetical protein|nr:hypothetical protein [Polyangiaceae bacterium]
MTNTDQVLVLRDMIVLDLTDRDALAQHMADAYALAGDAQLALAHFRQFRSTGSLNELELALDTLQARLFLLECGMRAG